MRNVILEAELIQKWTIKQAFLTINSANNLWQVYTSQQIIPASELISRLFRLLETNSI